jgi:exopolysaccharide biosynthesis polyprenyl glycosylphosphotransferase
VLKRFSLTYGLFSLFLDVIGIIVAFLFAAYLRRTIPYGHGIYHEGAVSGSGFHAVTVCMWLLVSFVVSLYDPRRVYKIVDELQALTLSVAFFTLAVAGMLYFTFRDTSRLLVIYALLTAWLLLMLWRVAIRLFFRLRRRWHPGMTNRVLIVGAGQLGQRIAATIREYAWTGLSLVGYLDDDSRKRGNGLPVLGSIAEICDVVRTQAIDDVVLALPYRAHGQVNEVVSALQSLPVRVRVVPDCYSLALYRATADEFGGIPMINLRDPVLNDYQRLAKRVLDVTIGGLLTLLALPVMALVALAVRLESCGPALFCQERVGENGRPFTMYKFRSMVNGADNMLPRADEKDLARAGIHKVPGDPRVTGIGRLIRRLSLDELPQLFNVLKGDMSLVGPRPELPWLVDTYKPWQRKRFAVPPGLTGWWQVNGRSDKPMHLHTDEDLYYIQNYSPWLDLYILLKTPLTVLRGKGAY